MKKIQLAALILATITLISCKNEKTKTVKLGGTIENPLNDMVFLFDENDLIQEPDTVFLDSGGNFMFSFELEEAGYFILVHDQFYVKLFLSPGNDLTLKGNTKDELTKIEFSGKGADENSFLAAKNEYLTENPFDSRELYSLREDVFKQKADSLLANRKMFTENYLKKNLGINIELVDYENISDMSLWASLRLSYKDAYPYYSGDSTYQPGENYYDFLSNFDFDQESNLKVRDFRQFLKVYINDQAKQLLEKDTSLGKKAEADAFARFEFAKSNFNNDKVKEFALFSVVKDQVDYYGIKGKEEIFTSFKASCTNEKLTEYIDKEYNKWLSIEPGKQAEDFTYPDLEGNMHSLSDFKGKYVYIDVWATWCGPCRDEIPHFARLVKDCKGKNIVFVSVSVDKNKADWEEMIRKDKPEWLQLHAGNGSTVISDFFIIKSIPRFILLDNDGRIIEANAKRPSANVKEQILGLEGI